MPQHLRVTYNDIHKHIRAASERIRSEFQPDLFIAIGESVEMSFCVASYLEHPIRWRVSDIDRSWHCSLKPFHDRGFFPARLLVRFYPHDWQANLMTNINN